MPFLASAQTEPPQFVTVDGRLYNSASPTNPLLDSSVAMTIQVLNPAKTCILYEEQQAVNTLASNGYFNVRVGSPTSGADSLKRSTNDSGNTMMTVFQNQNSAITGKTSSGIGCSYTPSSGDARYFRFVVTPSTTGVTTQLSPDMTIDSVPQALVAESLQGLGTSDFVQISANVTQAKLESLLGASYASLTGLLAGTSSLYLQNTVNGTLIPSRPNDPASPASGQIWYDSTANALKYYDGTTIQTLGTVGGGDPTKLPLAGGTMTGPIAMGSNDITAAGHITQSAQRTLRFGGYTGGQEATLTAGLLAGQEGTTWYNTTTDKLMYWNGTASEEVLTTASANSLVPNCTATQSLQMSAGPVYVWSCVATTDSTKLPLAGGTMTGNITMGGNQILGAGHITQALQSTITIGRYTNAQETTLTAALNASNKGAIWYNSDTDRMMYWDGAGAHAISNTTTGGGDITAVNTNAGSGLSGGAASGAATLQVEVDGVGLEINGSNDIQLKDSGVVTAKIANDAVTSAKILDGEIVNADINAAAAIAWSKIDKTGATAADVNAVAKAGDSMTGALTMNAQNQVRYADAAGGEYAAIQAPATIGTNYVLTLPVDAGSSGQVLQTNGSGVLSWISIPSAPVASVFGRTGAVVSANGDYTASQVTNVAAGSVAATTVQAAIDELDTEKVPTTRTITTTASTSGLTGGGDLSANRSLSVDITGTTAETAVAGADEILIWDASATALRKMTRTNFVLSEAEVDAMVSNNGYLTAEADTLATVTGRGASTSTNITLDARAEVRLADTAGGEYAALKAPATIGANYTLVLPDTDGDANQVLQTDGAGVLSWISIPSAPVSSVHGRTGAVVSANGDYTASQVTNVAAGNIAATTVQAAIDELDTEKVAKAGDAMTGALTMNAQNQIRYADSAGGEYAAIQAPATIGTNYVLTLPVDAGSNGQVLTTNGSGVLSWTTPTTGDITDVVAGAGLTGGATSGSATLDIGAGAGISVAADAISVNITGTTAETVPAAGDEILIYDASATALRKMTRGDFLTGYLTSESDTLATVTSRGASTATTVTMSTEAAVRFEDAAGGQYVALKSPATVATSYTLTLPDNDGNNLEVLQTDGNGVLSWVAIPSAPVASVFGRTGAVVSANGDYTASQVTNVAAGSVAATTVQAAIDELDTEKVPTTRTISTTASTSGLTGGGDLSANRSLSVDITGTTAETVVAGADEILIWDASATALRKMTRTNFVLSEAEVDAMVSNNGYLTAEADTLATVTGRGASTGTDITLNAQTDVRFADAAGGEYAAIQAPATIGANYTLTLPTTDGNNLEVLQTDGNGVLSWVAIPSAPVTTVHGRTGAVVSANGDYTASQVTNVAAGNIAATTVQAAIDELDTEKVAKAGDAMTGALTMNAQNQIRYADSAGGEYAAIQAPATIATNYVLTLPADAGSNGQVLTTNGSGVLSWTTPTTGDITDVVAGAGLTGGATSGSATLDIGAGAGISVAADAISVNITGTTAETVPAAGDEILIYDASATALRKITRGDFLTGYLTSESDTLATVTGRGANTSTNITMDARAEVRLADTAGGEYAALKAPATIGANYTLILPDTDGDANQVLQTDGAGVLSWVAIPSAPVSSVFGRTGAVVSANGDYTASQVTNVAAGSVAATTVQAAIDELDTEKVPTTRTITTTASTSGLTGGGDLSANRSLSVDITGTTAETTVAGADEILIWDASATALRKMTRTNFVLSEAEVDAMVSNNGYLTAEADTLATVTGRGASTGTDITLNTQTDVRFADAAGGEYAAIQAPATIGANYTLTLPTTDGNNLDVLQTDGNGVLSWVAIPSAPVTTVHGRTGAVVSANGDYTASQVTNVAAGSVAATTVQAAIDELDTEKVAKAGDAMTGALTMNAQNQIRYADSAGGEYAAIQAPATIATNYVLTLPVDAGASGQFLQTNGSGVLSWANAPAPTADSLDFTHFVDAMTLDASTDIAVTGTNVLSVTNSGTGNSFVVNDDTGDTSPFVIAADGKVGIGTTSPIAGSLLDVAGDIYARGTHPDLYVYFDSSNYTRIHNNGSNSYLDYHGGDFFLRDDGVITMRVSSGQFSIGPLPPTERLDVDGRIVSRPYGTGAGQTGQLMMRELAASPGGTDTVTIRAPDSVGTSFALTLPDTAGSNGQVLQTNGSGVLSWVAIPSAPVTTVHGRTGAVVSANGDYTASQVTNVAAGNIAATTVQAAIDELDTEKVAKAGDAMTGALTMNAQNQIRYADSAGGEYAAIQAPATIATNYVLTLPVDAGSNGQVLTTNGSGVLSWTTTAGDNLGNHTAGMNLNMNGHRITGVNVGSAAAPGLHFNGDPDTGIRRSAADEFSIVTGGADRLIVDSSGNVGIGTTTPGATLQLGTAGTTLGTMRLTGNTSGFVQIQPAAAAGSWTMTLPDTAGSNGQVLQTNGSGVLSWVAVPSAPVSSVFGRTGAVVSTNGDYTASQVTNVAAGSVAATTVQAAIDELDTEKVAKAGDSMTGALTMNAQNQVRYADSAGGEYAAIQAPATIATNYVLTLPVDAGASGQFLQTNGSGVLSWANAPAPTADSLDFTHFVDAMTLDASTDIAATGTNVLSITNSGTGDSFRVNDQASDTSPFVIDAAGQVGVGTTAPSALLQVGNSSTGSLPMIVVGTASGVHQTLVVQNVTDGQDQGPSIAFRNSWGNLAQISSTRGVTSTTSDMRFSTVTGSVLTEQMRINNSGFVGIGTTTPGTILDAAGAITSRPSGTGTGQTGQLIMRELAASPGGTDTVTIRAPDSVGTSFALTLPGTAGSSGQILSTDGTGILSWISSPLPSADSLNFTEFADAMTLDASTDIAVTGTNVLSVTNSGTGNSFVVNDQASDTTPFVVDASGNVGVGTTSPSAGLHVATNGAASSPGQLLNGTWFSGGTATTTKPHLLIEPSGTTSTSWSTSGTAFGINAAGSFGGDMVNIKHNNSTVFSIATYGGLYSLGDATFNSNNPTVIMAPNGPSTVNHVQSSFYTRALNSSWSSFDAARIDVIATNVSPGTESSNMSFKTAVAGTLAERVVISGSSVGIGTTTPGTILDAAGAITSRPSGTGTGQTGQLIMRELAASPGGTDTVTIRAPDSVGTSFALTLPGTAGSSGQILSTDGTGILSWISSPLPAADSLNFTEFADAMTLDASTDIAVTGTNVLSVTNSGTGVSFRVNDQAGDTSPFVIDASGNVGIGSSAPTGTLDVNGGSAAANTAGSSITLRAQNSTGPASNIGGGLNFYTGTGAGGWSDGHVNFYLGGGRFSISGPGDNYSATGAYSGPTGQLHLLMGNFVDGTSALNSFMVRNSANDQRAYFGAVSSAGGGVYTPSLVWGQQSGVSSYAERMRLDSNGRLGIGTTAPGTLLDVSGAITSRPSGTGTGQTGQLIMRELAASPGGTDTVTIRAPDSVGTSFALTLPSTAGSSGQVLSTNGSGVLSWVTAPTNGGTFSAADGTAASPSFTFSSDTNTGMYTPGADRVALAVGGDKVLEAYDQGTYHQLFFGNAAVGTYDFNFGTSAYGVSSSGVITLGGDTGATITGTSTGSIALYGQNLMYDAQFSSYRTAGFSVASGYSGIEANTGKITIYTGSGGTGYYSTITPTARLTVLPTGEVGIGTTTPGTILDAGGAITSRPFGTGTGQTGQLIMRELAASPGGTDTVTIRAPDSVGTSFALTLPGTAGSNGQVLSTDGAGILSWITPTATITDDSLNFDKFSDTMALDASTDIAVDNAEVLSVTNTGTGNSFVVSDQASDTSPFVIDPAGNVGIGSTTPATALDVVGTITASSMVNAAGNITSTNGSAWARLLPTGFISVSKTSGSAASMMELINTSTAVNSGGYVAFQSGSVERGRIYGNVGSGTGNRGYLRFDTQINGTMTEVMRLDQYGYVGIGTTTPGTLLDVAGAITSRPFGTATGETGQLIMRELAAGGTETVTLRAPDAITTSFALTLPTSAGSSGQVLSTNGTGTLSWIAPGTPSADSLNFTEFADAMTLDASTDIAASGTQVLSVTNSGTGISFRVNDAAGDTTPFVVDASGNVGIGTTAPGYPLDVAGSLNVRTGNTYNLNSNPIVQFFSPGGFANIFLGTYGGSALSTGVANTGVGIYAGDSISSGGHNTVFGYSAGDSLSTNSDNTLIGSFAAYQSNGYSNTAVGRYINGSLTTGSSNTAMGNRTMFNNTTGDQNIAIGDGAMGFEGSGGAGDMDNNTVIGYQAGYNFTGGTSGLGPNNNILLGFRAGDTITTGDANILIGYDIDATSATTSNFMSIGNIIYATSVDGTGTTVSSGNVGIKTASPTSTLTINGSMARNIATVTAATYSVSATDTHIIANRAGTITITLPSAASFPGREISIRTITANTVVSASSNVVPMAGGAAGTAILAATAGKWAMLVSDGTNWQIQMGN